MLAKQLYLLPILISVLFYFLRPVISFKYADNDGIVKDNIYSQNGAADYLRYTRALQTDFDKRKFAGEKCFGYKGAEGKCVSLEKCALTTLSEDYIKYKDYLCVTKQRKVGVCCPNSTDSPILHEERKAEKIISNIKKRKVIRYKRDAVVNDPPKSIKAEANSCGRSGQQLSEDIKTGSPWPWIASLKIASSMSHFCGATLISRYHLLSAAHCFVLEGGIAKKENVIVRLGDYDFNDANGTKYSNHKVAAIIPHEDYDVFTYENDIVLLLLEKPAEFSVYVQPICMPKVEVYNNRKATVVGWGHVKTGGPGSEILREIEVPVWQHASCEDSIAQTIFTTNVCAGDEDGKKDACQNDSGGPLMMKRKVGSQMRWELAGIVSWGVKCAQKGRPGVYTQVNKYLDWIYSKLNDS